MRLRGTKTAIQGPQAAAKRAAKGGGADNLARGKGSTANPTAKMDDAFGGGGPGSKSAKADGLLDGIDLTPKRVAELPTSQLMKYDPATIPRATLAEIPPAKLETMAKRTMDDVGKGGPDWAKIQRQNRVAKMRQAVKDAAGKFPSKAATPKAIIGAAVVLLIAAELGFEEPLNAAENVAEGAIDRGVDTAEDVAEDVGERAQDSAEALLDAGDGALKDLSGLATDTLASAGDALGLDLVGNMGLVLIGGVVLLVFLASKK